MDLENLCTCRASRDWGTICAHSVAVGLHCLKPAARVGENEKGGKGAGEKLIGSHSPAFSPAHLPKDVKQLQRAAPGDANGEPIELHIILPPNFADAAVRGKVMLVFEGKRAASVPPAKRGQQDAGGTLQPLNALPKDVPFQLSAEDERVLNHIEELAGEPAGMLVLTTHEFVELLPALMEHPRVTLGKTTPLQIAREPWVPSLRADVGEEWRNHFDSGVAEESARVHRRRVDLCEPDIAALGFAKTISCRVARARPHHAPGCAGVSEQRFRRALQRECAPWKRTSRSMISKSCRSRRSFCCISPAASRNSPPNFSASIRRAIITAGASSADDSPWMPDANQPTRYAMRDFGAEQQALARLLRAGFSSPDAQGRYQLNGQERVLNFFAREFPRMQKEWEVTLEERLGRSTREKIERIEPRFEITPSGVQWFDFGVSFAIERGRAIFFGGHSAADSFRPEPHAIEERQGGGDRHGRGRRVATVSPRCFARTARRKVSTWQCAGGISRSDVGAARLAGAGAATLARARAAAKRRSEARMPAARRFGKRVAPVSKARRRVDEFSARERLRRNPRGRNGFGENAAGAGVLRNGVRTAAVLPKTGGSDHRQDCRHCTLRPWSSVPHPRLQLGRRSEEVHAGVEGRWRCTDRSATNSSTKFRAAI